MAKLKTPKAVAAWDKVMNLGLVVTGEKQFQKAVDDLIRAVQDETELALMKGKVRFLSEPYMLYHALEFVVGMERRPLHRAAAIKQIQEALHKYLGLDFTPQPKRKRRKLLPHV